MAKDVDRPMCKFGEKCFRRNPAHLKEYKHPENKLNVNDIATKLTKRKSDESDLKVPKKAKIDDFFQKKNDTPSTDQKIDDFFKPEATNEETLDAVAGNSSGYVRDDKEEGADSNEIIEDNNGSGELEIEDDPKKSIKDKFLVDMPEDFYHFWELCKLINPQAPKKAFADCGLLLVGPYDILDGKVKHLSNKGAMSSLVHWRYYYDPPEFLTVLKGDDSTMFHMGYFRDDPKEMPDFVASNAAANDGIITPRGGNLFAAVTCFIQEKYKQEKTTQLKKLRDKVEEFAKKHNYSLEQKTQQMKDRGKKCVCKTFHGAGLIVPVDDNDVGYRPVPESTGNLKKMFKNIVESKSQDERDKSMDALQELVTYIQFANDECDYGEGLELGLDLFSFGGEQLHPVIMTLLPLGYQLLGRPQYSQIITEHLKNRRKTAKLSSFV